MARRKPPKESDPALEAVRLDRKRRVISVATLGQAQREDWPGELTAAIQRLERAGGTGHCALVDGDEACQDCADFPAATRPLPLPEKD